MAPCAQEQTIGVLPDPGAALPRAASFAVTLPEGFVADAVPGRYVAVRYPLDAANITVEVTELAQERRYTNAEKRAMAEAGERVERTSRDYGSLTAELYEEAANEALGEGLTLRVSSFVHTVTKRAADGASFPGFRIRAELEGGRKPITEDVYLILSEDKLFTVTYAWASDDEFDQEFQQSAASIAVY